MASAATALGQCDSSGGYATDYYVISYDNQTVTSSGQMLYSNVWPSWNATYDVTTPGGFTTNAVWTNWGNAYISGLGAQTQALGNQQAPAIIIRTEPSEQERIMLEQLERDQRERAEKIEAARVRAEALLLDHLDSDQIAEFRRSRCFIVQSRDGVRRYRIDYGKQGNVKLLGELPFHKDRAVATFCIHPDLTIPTEDCMLAQKLLLETDEKAFLRIANRRAA